jgi:hypothetical protein
VTLPPVAVPRPAVQSSLTVTIQQANLAPVQAKIGGTLPGHVQSNGEQPHYDFYRSDDRGMWVEDDGYVVFNPQYHGSAGYSGLGINVCNLDPLYLGVFARFQPALTKNPDGWHLAANNPQVVLFVGPGSDTHCSFANISVAGLLDQALGNLSSNLTSKVQAAKVDIPVDSVASKVQGPFAVPIQGSSAIACIYPNVDGVALGRLRGYGYRPTNMYGTRNLAGLNPVDIPFLISGSPTLLITTGTCPPAASGTIVLARSPTAGESFNVLATLGVDYGTLSSLASNEVTKLSGSWGWLGLPFHVSDVQARDASGQVLVAVTLSGSLNGTVYFWGTPVLSHNGQTISVPDAELAAASRSALLGIDIRLPDLIVGLFRQPIRNVLVHNLGPDLATVAAIGSKNIGIPGGGSLSLGSVAVKPLDVRSSPSGLNADVLVTGTATAVVPAIPGLGS